MPFVQKGKCVPDKKKKDYFCSAVFLRNLQDVNNKIKSN